MEMITALKLNQNERNEIYEWLEDYIPKNKLNKLKAFSNFKDYKRGLLGEIFLRSMISISLNIDNKDIEITKNDFGKPLIKQNDFHFNISHSGDWIVYAQHTLPIGVDIEKIKKTNLSIAKRFFTPEEYESLLSKDPSEQLNFFFDLWTLKESYVKAIGKGLSMGLKSVKFDLSNNEIKSYTSPPLKKLSFKQYNISDLYKVAVCKLDNNPFPNTVNIINESDLLNKLNLSLYSV